MMVFSLGFIIFAILTCCFAVCGNSTEGEKKSHSKEVRNSVHMGTRLVCDLRVIIAVVFYSLDTHKVLCIVLGPEKLANYKNVTDEDNHSFQFFFRREKRAMELVCGIFFIQE